MAYKSNTFMDNAIALRLLVMLTTPFNEMEAYKVGIIDAKGKYIIPQFKRTNEQRKSLTYLDRLIINTKKIINKLPGGENNLKNLVSAMILIKENLEKENSIILTEESFEGLYDDPEYMDDRNRFIRTWCDYLKLKEEIGTGAIASGTPTNNTNGVALYAEPLNKSRTIYRRKQNA